MSERDGSDFGTFISGFFIGGIVGAAVALLLAPQSGEETRMMIHEKGIEIKEQVQQTAADARAKAEKLALEAKSKAEALQKRGQVILEESKARIEQSKKRKSTKSKPSQGGKKASADA